MAISFCLSARGFFRMNILHTSDWHIGKRLMDRERLPEQTEALEELVCICERERVDVVLVAGDVFDTFMPSAEAEEVFFRAVKRLAGDRRAVVLISGNHDDGVRLAASAPLSAEEGIYLFGGGRRSLPVGGARGVHAVQSGENYILLENEAGERLFVNALPYPNEARLREEKTEESYPEKVSRWIAAGGRARPAGVPYVLLTHLFAAGGVSGESERDIELGGARVVPLACFPEDAFTALGHLHKRQRLRDNVYYSGSLLQYSFDEANIPKSAALLTTKGDKVIFSKEIPLVSGKKLVRLEAAGVEQALMLLQRYEGAFIELTLHLTAPLTSRETMSLREANEGLVSLIVRTQAAIETPEVVRSTLSSGELFAAYYQSVYGEDPSDELKEAFLQLLAEDA